MRHEPRNYYVYIMSNHARMLYTGVTNDLERRVFEHRSKLVPGFTKQFNLTRLVYFEVTGDVTVAIAREKEIKGWVRRKKVALICSANPGWEDLSLEWLPPDPETESLLGGERQPRREAEPSTTPIPVRFTQGDKGMDARPYVSS